MVLTRKYEFTGIIQGVGFRPCIARLAQMRNISGSIQNRSGSVCAEFTAEPEDIDWLIDELQSAPPALSRIDRINMISEKTAADPVQGFHILEGKTEDTRNIMIPADVAMCPDCAREITDPEDRRFRYPFTTCVNCGPRYTVITNMPYERSNTAMKHFPLCPDCRREYESPSDRRFHAETTCCPDCGPRLELIMPASASEAAASTASGPREHGPARPENPAQSAKGNEALRLSRNALADGKIVAVKGIGGFLLAADPHNIETVKRLRSVKNRPHKPLAIMARNISVIKNMMDISDDEERLLKSPQAPIVILDTSKCSSPPFDLSIITPDTNTVGMMLPTSPLHTLLFTPAPDDLTPPLDFLIMTSGNKHSEPICLTAEEAEERLNGIAENILTHNRPITLRNDDSLCIVNSSGPQIWRRARGFAPSPIQLSVPFSKNILGMGAEIKSCITIGYGNEAVVSPHIGDLETPEAVEHMNLVAKSLPDFLGKKVESVAIDLNPDMHSSIAGRKLADKYDLPCFEIQHHEAHAAACLAENGLHSGLALTLDGTGLGRDGTVWGAELFYVEDGVCSRLATYCPAPLPGADRAVTLPVRQLIGRFTQCGRNITEQALSVLGVSPEEYNVWQQQCRQELNCPASSGAGRLFDSVAALLGLTAEKTTYEGQPAIRLEAAAKRFSGAPSKEIPFRAVEKGNLLQIDWMPFFESINDIPAMRANAEDYAMSFHTAVIDSSVKMIEYGLSMHHEKHVALSGGVFMNQILHRGLCDKLRSMGLIPVTHSLLPPNDGCISFGQVVQANRLLRSK